MNRTTRNGFLGFGFLLLVLVVVIGPTLIGLSLAFKASIILGIVTLLLEPTPFIFGVAALLGHPELLKKLADWLHLPI